MKKKEALPLIKDWSRFYMESIQKILSVPDLEAKIRFYVGRVVGDNTPYCAFSFHFPGNAGLEISPSGGVTRVPAIHGSVFADQILEDILGCFMDSEVVDFSHFVSQRGMLPPSFYGFYMGEEDPRICINFDGVFPSREAVDRFEEALTLKEEKKNGRKR